MALTYVTIGIEGVTPLMQHNERLANPLDPVVRKLKPLTSKRNKTEDDHLVIARAEWEGGLYWDQQVGIYVPGANIWRCIVEGGRLSKQGVKIERGLLGLVEAKAKLHFPEEGASLEQMWDRGLYDQRMVKIGTSKTLRTRPLFPVWSLVVDAAVDPQVLDVDTLTNVAVDAGRFVGLGEARKLGMGRFDATITKVK